MVLDLIVSPHLARKQPWRLLIAAVFFVTFGVFAHLWLPTVKGSIIIFAMIPAIPLFWSLVVREEAQEEKVRCLPTQSFAYHKRLIVLFAYLFVGSAAAYAFWYAVLPAEVSANAFQDQLQEIKTLKLIGGGVTGKLLAEASPGIAALTGRAFSTDFFWTLLAHNMNVLVILFALSLVYGIGSIYVLLWNASIIGVFIGLKVQAQGGIGILTAVLGLLPHGMLEIGGYLLASIAGGILSAAIMRHHFKRPEFKWIIIDVVLLAVVSILMLAAGAAIEATY